MGSFYVNFSVKGVTQSELAHDLRVNGVEAFIGGDQEGWCSFVEKEADSQDESVIARIGKEVCSRLGKPVVSVLNHDDDILAVDLFVSGEMVAGYNSCPGYFDDDPEPERLLPLFTNIEEFVKLRQGLAAAIIQNALVVEEIDSALEAHERLIEHLGLPAYSAGFGFRYALRGELPDDSIRT